MTQKAFLERRLHRPICSVLPLPPVDLQALAPAGWCDRCGGEVYRLQKELCQRCRRFERRKYYDKREISQPLSDLY